LPNLIKSVSDYYFPKNCFSSPFLVLFSRQILVMNAQPQPIITPKLQQPKFGFNEYAERLNGRAAMIGFSLMVIIEYVTNQGVLTWLSLK